VIKLPAAGLNPIFPVIKEVGTSEIPLPARIVKGAAAPRAIGDGPNTMAGAVLKLQA